MWQLLHSWGSLIQSAKTCDYHLKLSLHAKLSVKSKRILYCSARGYRPKAASCNIDQRMTRWQTSFSHVVLKLSVTTPHYFYSANSDGSWKQEIQRKLFVTRSDRKTAIDVIGGSTTAPQETELITRASETTTKIDEHKTCRNNLWCTAGRYRGRTATQRRKNNNNSYDYWNHLRQHFCSFAQSFWARQQDRQKSRKKSRENSREESRKKSRESGK